MKFQMVELGVICRDGSKQIVTVSVVPNITCPIQKLPLDLSAYSNFQSLPLAEPLISNPEFVSIDVLIGGDHYYDFVMSNRLKCPDGLILLESKLGYITAGRVAANTMGPETVAVMLLDGNPTSGQYDDRVFDIQRYWELDDIGLKDSSIHSTADEKALEHFNFRVRIEDVRYLVQWPWKTENPDLPNNFALAFGRLKSLLKMVQTDSKLSDTYESTFKEQLSRGIIEYAPSVPDSNIIYYIPHHPVIKPQRTTTKIRIVYDASSKTNKELASLNDCVHRGPVF